MTNMLELFLPILCFGNLLFITMIADYDAEKKLNDYESNNGFFASLV